MRDVPAYVRCIRFGTLRTLLLGSGINQANGTPAPQCKERKYVPFPHCVTTNRLLGKPLVLYSQRRSAVESFQQDCASLDGLPANDPLLLYQMSCHISDQQAKILYYQGNFATLVFILKRAVTPAAEESNSLLWKKVIFHYLSSKTL